MITSLPSQYLTASSPPTDPTDFVGPARAAAVKLKQIVEHSLANGCPAIKLFYSGPSGTGKTALAYYAQHLLKVSRFAVTEVNGTDVTIDWMRALTESLHLCHNELFGDYRLITIHEADTMSNQAQVKMLTTLDNLPNRTAMILTTNAKRGSMEARFERRFMYTEIGEPTAEEIAVLLSKWNLPPYVATMIAVGACGNVGMAMQEAAEWLQTNPSPDKTARATRSPATGKLNLEVANLALA